MELWIYGKGMIGSLETRLSELKSGEQNKLPYVSDGRVKGFIVVDLEFKKPLDWFFYSCIKCTDKVKFLLNTKIII